MTRMKMKVRPYPCHPCNPWSPSFRVFRLFRGFPLVARSERNHERRERHENDSAKKGHPQISQIFTDEFNLRGPVNLGNCNL
jgi:hypothetical protein